MSAGAELPPRINRFLADCGLGSRRSCESLVAEGRVQINGEICTALATRVSPSDRVTVDGKPLRPGGEAVSLLLYKPREYLCTRADPEGRETIFDLLPPHLKKRRDLHYAGRLDRDSEGLLVLTSDGDISHQLTHPSHKVEKEYIVNLVQPFNDAHIEPMLAGIKTTSGQARATAVEKVSKRTIAIVLEQGLKRQIRQMLAELGYGVKRLVRARIGGLTAPDLKPGEWRMLGRRDFAQIFGKTKR